MGLGPLIARGIGAGSLGRPFDGILQQRLGWISGNICHLHHPGSDGWRMECRSIKRLVRRSLMPDHLTRSRRSPPSRTAGKVAIYSGRLALMAGLHFYKVAREEQPIPTGPLPALQQAARGREDCFIRRPKALRCSHCSASNGGRLSGNLTYGDLGTSYCNCC